MGMFDTIYVKGRKYQGLFNHEGLQTKDFGLELAEIDLIDGRLVPSVPGVYGGDMQAEINEVSNGKVWGCQYYPRYRHELEWQYGQLVDWVMEFKNGELFIVQASPFKQWLPQWLLNEDVVRMPVITYCNDPDIWQLHPLVRIDVMRHAMKLPGSRRKFTARVKRVIAQHGIDAAHRWLDKRGMLRVYDPRQYIEKYCRETESAGAYSFSKLLDQWAEYHEECRKCNMVFTAAMLANSTPVPDNELDIPQLTYITPNKDYVAAQEKFINTQPDNALQLHISANHFEHED